MVMHAEGEIVTAEGMAAAPMDFRTFFEDEHRRLLKTLHFVTGDRAEAADLMQEAFLKVWERWDRVAELEDPVAYLFKVALNGSRTRIRVARRTAARQVPLRLVRDEFEEVDAREDVLRMLRGVTPRQRAALLLLDLYGYGSQEAAHIMGIRPSTVRALAAQGRAALRTAGGGHD
jgi:RNA polymerase sigma factor (sigma-70 family)